MVEADKLLEDEELIDAVYEAQGRASREQHARAVARKRQPRWRCGCCCSSMYATGASTRWSAR